MCVFGEPWLLLFMKAKSPHLQQRWGDISSTPEPTHIYRPPPPRSLKNVKKKSSKQRYCGGGGFLEFGAATSSFFFFFCPLLFTVRQHLVDTCPSLLHKAECPPLAHFGDCFSFLGLFFLSCSMCLLVSLLSSFELLASPSAVRGWPVQS